MMSASGDIDLVDHLEARAQAFSAMIASRPSVQRIEAPNFVSRAKLGGTLVKPVVWRNDVFVGPEFRWAHVEYFSIRDQIGVIHVSVLPQFDRHAPIFGFDVISGGKKATGAFLDLSPTTAEAAALSDAWAAGMRCAVEGFQEKRPLPDWATSIFSEHALAIRPTSPWEVERVLSLAESSLALWFSQEKPIGNGAAMTRAQQRYAAAQRRNVHTFRMLAGCVGAEIAREFVENWLFPEPMDPDSGLLNLALAS